MEEACKHPGPACLLAASSGGVALACAGMGRACGGEAGGGSHLIPPAAPTFLTAKSVVRKTTVCGQKGGGVTNLRRGRPGDGQDGQMKLPLEPESQGAWPQGNLPVPR